MTGSVPPSVATVQQPLDAAAPVFDDGWASRAGQLLSGRTLNLLFSLRVQIFLRWPVRWLDRSESAKALSFFSKSN